MSGTGVRKLCATGWLARTPALQDVLRSYDALQMCFEDFAQSSGACHAKANGIAVFLGKSLSYLGIYVLKPACFPPSRASFSKIATMWNHAESCYGCCQRAA